MKNKNKSKEQEDLVFPPSKTINSSAIYHERFDLLHELTGSYNKATLLDKLIFWWQISTYTLDDNRIWFTRSIEQISEQSKIPRRSVERYLHEFERDGLIERINRLMRTKHLYIRVTEKLFAYIHTPAYDTSPEKITKTPDTPSSQKNCFFSNHIGAIDNADLAFSINKVNDYNQKNNSIVSVVLPVDKETESKKQESKYPLFPIEKIIGERVEEQGRNYIKGMLHNLEKNHQVHISSPEQTFAEIIFAVTHEEQMKGINDFRHRVNIAARLLKQNRWKTPKGFYNHSDYGKPFRKRDWTKPLPVNTHQESEATITRLKQTLLEVSTELQGEHRWFESMSESCMKWGVAPPSRKRLNELAAREETLMMELKALIPEKPVFVPTVKTGMELQDELQLVCAELQAQESWLERARNAYGDHGEMPDFTAVRCHIKELQKQRHEIEVSIARFSERTDQAA